MPVQTLGNVLAGLRACTGFAVAVMTVIVFGQESRQADELKQSDVKANVPVVSFRGDDDEITSVSFSEDGNRVVSLGGKAICIWDAATGTEHSRLKVDEQTALGVSRDFSRLAIARSFHFDVPAAHRGAMTLRDTTSGKDMWTIEPHGDWNRDVPFVPVIAAVAFSPDGKSLATAGGVVKVRGSLHRGIVKIWEAETGRLLRQLDELSSRADAVTFSSDGKYLAAGTIGTSGELPESAEVHVWDTATGQRLHTMKTRPEVEQGGNPGSVMQMAFHPQETRLAAAVSDGTLRLWELPSGRELYELRGHQGRSSGNQIDAFTGRIIGRSCAVRAVAFNPDGSRLASAGHDRIVRVWNSQTGEQTATYRFDSPRINAVAFNSDGQRLAAAGSNSQNSGEVVIWKWSDNSDNLGGHAPPTVRKDEIAKRELEVRQQIENAVKSDELQWQNLDAAQRGIRDRIAKVLHKTVTLGDQQAVLAVYLLTIGRPPTDAEAKHVQKEFTETKDRPLSVLQHARGLVRSKEFNARLAASNVRLFKIQKDLEGLVTKRATGEIPFLMTADELQKLAGDCAATVDQAAKTDQQFVDLAYLLALSRFPSTTETNQLVPHLMKAPDRATATREIFVILLNNNEFVAAK